MTDVTPIRRRDGVVQGYHTGPQVTGNADARAAFNPRPRYLPIEQCPSFQGAVRHYRERPSLDWTWNRDLVTESGLPPDVVDELVERYVHREVLEQFGDPRSTQAFAAAVAATRRAEADPHYWAHIEDAARFARREVLLELLDGRTSPGRILDAAVDEAVFDALND